MKKCILFSTITALATTLSVSAQTWNIPAASTTTATGIGTNATAGTDDFNIIAGGNTVIKVKENGNIGIGTTSPTTKLAVSGSIGSTSLITNEITIDNNAATGTLWYQNYDDTWHVGVVGASNVGSGSSSLRLYAIGGGDGLLIDFSGRVLIGASSWPSNTSCNKLHVAGTIGAQEVNVSTTNWCDYVFDTNYKLKSIKEVEAFILANKHLPEVPSEKEVKDNGIGVSEMFKIQMKKIEELTLYIIELQKQNEKLAAAMARLNK